jgi:hypothetical protein
MHERERWMTTKRITHTYDTFYSCESLDQVGFAANINMLHDGRLYAWDNVQLLWKIRKPEIDVPLQY